MSEIDRDEIEGMDPALIPIWRSFPIPAYAAILGDGKAAASKKRYATREAATREVKTVATLLAYYRKNHPEIAPTDFGYRVWESREDGRYRWAILPEPLFAFAPSLTTSHPLGGRDDETE